MAFSGEVVDPATLKKFTEPELNQGIREKELPECFDSLEYNVLLVSDKYQTGFDQPYLHTMYVDKKLGGVQAVQTLSRLNRKPTGKTDTFILDFVNDWTDIYFAFKPYYERTDIGDAPDPQRLYAMQHEILDTGIVVASEIDAFCNIWFGSRGDRAGCHQRINFILDVAVERFTQYEEREQELFRGKLKGFSNLYGFLTQIIPYGDSDLEKLYAYGRFLLTKLPTPDTGGAFTLEGEVALRYYRLEKIEERRIALESGDTQPLKGPTDLGTAQGQEPEVPLSTLVDNLNHAFGTNFTAFTVSK